MASSEKAIELKQKGDDSVKRGEFDKAIEYYKNAVDLDPFYVSAWNNLGYALFKSGRKEEAEDIKSKIIGIKEREEILNRDSNENTQKLNIWDYSKKSRIYLILIIIAIVICGTFINLHYFNGFPDSTAEISYIPVTITITPTNTQAIRPPTQIPTKKSTPSINYHTDDSKLLDLMNLELKNKESSNFGNALHALNYGNYAAALDYSEKAMNEIKIRERDATRLSVSHEFQTIRSLFIEYLEFEKIACDDIRESAHSFKDGSFSSGYKYRINVTNDIDRMNSKLNEINMYIKFLQ